MKVGQDPGQDHNAKAQMEFLVISIFNIFKWLFPTKTKNVSFYSLSHVLSDTVINFIQIQYQNFTFFVITVKCIDEQVPHFCRAKAASAQCERIGQLN